MEKYEAFGNILLFVFTLVACAYLIRLGMELIMHIYFWWQDRKDKKR